MPYANMKGSLDLGRTHAQRQKGRAGVGPVRPKGEEVYHARFHVLLQLPYRLASLRDTGRNMNCSTHLLRRSSLTVPAFNPKRKPRKNHLTI